MPRVPRLVAVSKTKPVEDRWTLRLEIKEKTEDMIMHNNDIIVYYSRHTHYEHTHNDDNNLIIVIMIVYIHTYIYIYNYIYIIHICVCRCV